MPDQYVPPDLVEELFGFRACRRCGSVALRVASGWGVFAVVGCCDCTYQHVVGLAKLPMLAEALVRHDQLALAELAGAVSS